MQARPDSTGEPTAEGLPSTVEGKPSMDLPEHLKVNSRGLPGKVFSFRQKLYLKAKWEPAFRFYTLYDRICRPDVVQAAWDRVSANGGAPGVDGVSIEAVRNSEHGVSGFVSEIVQSFKDRTYRPDAVKARMIRPRSAGASRERRRVE